jgi:hypothetical protein
MSSLDPTATATGAVTSSSATKTAKRASIKVLTGFSKLSVNGLANLASAVVKGMTGNTAFPSPPVSLTAFSAGLATFSAAIVAALDGGKNAKAVQKTQRKLITQDLTLLAVYVQNNCNDDPALVTSSGFGAKAQAKTATGQVAVPGFRSLDFGVNSGQVAFRVSSVDGAKAYFARYTVMSGTTPGAWTTLNVASLKTATTISGLTPGTTYGFQVQALGSLGYSDWSATETIMCI